MKRIFTSVSHLVIRITLLSTVIVLLTRSSYSQGVWLIENNGGLIGGYGMASTVVNGKIYLFGGQTNLELLTTVCVFDVNNNRWTSPQYSGTFTPRRMMSADYVNGKIYVIGGDVVTQNGGLGTNVIEAYDPVTSEWTVPQVTGSMTPRRNHASVVINDKIYLFGGCDGDIDIETVDVFDPQTLHWTNLTTTGTFTPRRSLTASLINGKVYVFGGAAVLPTPNGALDILEVFDPQTNTWTTPAVTGDITARRAPTSCVYNGMMYIFGGNDGQYPISKLQMFDPMTNQWSTPNAIGYPTPRNGPSSAVIGDKLYFIAGAGQGYNAFESFTPEKSSVDANDNSGISLFPAIVSSQLTIYNNRDERYSLTITNILGSTIFSSDKNDRTITINVADYSGGIYFVKVQTSSRSYVLRFIKR